MKKRRVAEVEALIREIQRYLAYVDAFRSLERPTGRDPGHRRARRKES